VVGGELMPEIHEDLGRSEIDAVQGEPSRALALLPSDGRGVLHRDLRGVVDVAVHAVPRRCRLVTRLAGRLVELRDAAAAIAHAGFEYEIRRQPLLRVVETAAMIPS
jgi:hypothetical protein